MPPVPPVTDNELGVLTVSRYKVLEPLVICVGEFIVSALLPKFKVKAPVVFTVLEVVFTLFMVLLPDTVNVKPPLAVIPYD
jgi:hypothetical protein